MKAKELVEGKCYKIKYRTSLDKTRHSSYYGGSYYGNYKEKPQSGVGILKKKNHKSSMHAFQVDGHKGLVYASSNAIEKEVKAPSSLGKAGMLDKQMQRQLEKLRKLGLDDGTRTSEMALIVTVLYDLGIELKPDEECTSATIDFLSALNLKTLALELLSKSMERQDVI